MSFCHIRFSRFLHSGLVFLAVWPALLSCTTTPVTAPPEVADPSTFLGMAMQEAYELGDPVERALLLTRVAGGYIEIDDFRSARATANAALDTASGIPEAIPRVRVQLALVPVYAELGGPAAEQTLLAALTALDEHPNEDERAATLPSVVDAALQGGERTRFAVREAIDLVLIIVDPGLRADALIQVGTLYQESGIGLSVTSLIQQAIPATRSLDDPLRQVLFFSRLSVLAWNAGEGELVGRLTQMSMRLSPRLNDPELNGEEEVLLEAVRNFERVDQTAAASEFARLTPRSADEVPEEADLAEEIDTVPVPEHILAIENPEARASAALGRAEAVISAAGDEVPNITPLLDVAQQSLLSNPELQSRLELLRLLVTLRVTLDQIEPIASLINGARDQYLRGMIGLFAADALIDEGRFGLADDFLVVSLVASDETSFLADALRERIVRRFARTGSIRLAIRTIERISDPILRARAVVDLAVIAEPAGLMTPIYRTDLASVLS